MPINDYRCETCGQEYIDEFKQPSICVCGAGTIVMSTQWCDRRVGKTDNTNYCTDGVTINKFQAKHDPLCQIEVGLRGDNGTSLRTFTKEQQQHYAERMRREDSPRLRQEMLDVRSRNESEKKLKRIERSKKL